MLLNFCTLFDVNYLDKGLVLMDSLHEFCQNYMLYVLPMDKKCKYILEKLNLSNLIVLDYEDFEDEDLRRVKKDRTRAEYCWTCTSKLVLYLFEKYKVDICTYIDADLCFYHDPNKLIQEMLQDKKSVQIIRHNFCKYELKHNEKKSGIYCVEFNTFINNKDGLDVLHSWVSDCLKDCSYGNSDEVLGDQKYLNNWPNTYNCVNISSNLGAGIAPWNVNRFKIQNSNSLFSYQDKETKRKGKIVFFHFQNVRFIDKTHVYCCDVKKKHYEGTKAIYDNYLKQIMKKKKLLKEKFQLNLYLYEHPADTENTNKKKNMTNQKEYISREISLKNFIMRVHRKIVILLYYKRMKPLIVDIAEENYL